jgi:hypothetical protein
MHTAGWFQFPRNTGAAELGPHDSEIRIAIHTSLALISPSNNSGTNDSDPLFRSYHEDICRKLSKYRISK